MGRSNQSYSARTCADDLVHRGTARFRDEFTDDAPFRPMFKFLFNRTVAPTQPSWGHTAGSPTPTFAERLPSMMRPVAQSMWEWLSGSGPPPPLPNDAPLEPTVTGAEALYAVGEGLEAERIGCAYTLGRAAWHGVHTSKQTMLCTTGFGFCYEMIRFCPEKLRTEGIYISREDAPACIMLLKTGDMQALDCLLTALAAKENPNARRAAVSGLGAAGDAAVPGLLRALAAADRPQAVAQAAEALGEACRTPSTDVARGLAAAMAQLRSYTSSSSSSMLPDDESVGQPAVGHSDGTSFAADIEEEANSYFKKLYTSQQSIGDIISLLQGFKNSSNPREQDIFKCMIHNLFDEYRFFHKYPDKELKITGILFGSLIQHGLVSSIALRYALEALKSSASSKMFKLFGSCALEQFKSRVHEWPTYCSHILQIPHLRQSNPETVAYIEASLQAAHSQQQPQVQPGVPAGQPQPAAAQQQQQEEEGLRSNADSPVVTQALGFCTDALKYVAQRLHAQLKQYEQEEAHEQTEAQTTASQVVETVSMETAAEIASALLAALVGHPGDGDVVRECRGKALVSLTALPRAVWSADGLAGLADELSALASDGKATPVLRHLYIKMMILPRQARDKHRESTQKNTGVSLGSQYAMSMGSTGLARLARHEQQLACGDDEDEEEEEGGGSSPPTAGGKARAAVLERMVELRYVALDNNGLH
eukprot:COSAG06_NODE_1822_length_8283_cov_33.324255_5_plen_707_part_00